jgi:acyl-CoA synthetase (NDP forming)
LTPYARELRRSFGLHFANGFPFAVRALDHAIAYGEARARFERPRAERPAIARLDLTAGAGPLDEACSREILRQIGIPVPPARVARSGQEAARLATEAGFPVVLKVIAAGLAHKSRAGGVRLDVGNASEAEAAYAEMLAAVAEREPSVTVTGVLVDRQVFPSAELIAGVSRDPQFGPVVLAGSGGVLVELLDDTVLLLPPFDADFAAEQLAGLRGRPRADLRAAADVLVRLGWAALEEPRLAELDVNPLFVLEDGSVLAGDALVVLS